MRSPRMLYEIEDDTSTSAIAVGDLTHSGVAELCTGGRDGVLKLYDAHNGEVRLLAQHEIDGSILSIKIADANNDGQMEIVIGRSIGINETGTLQVYRYAPSGMLELLAEHAIGRFVTTVVVTDVTGDDKNEILAGGSDSTLRILKMDSENNLIEFTRHQLEDMPITIGTCDVIGDEIEEIVTGNRDKTLRVFKVRGEIIDEIEVLKLPSPVISLASGDILGDRKMELGVVTHDGSIRVYRNEESKLDLFSKLDNVNALSIRIDELNADHMDEIVIATSDSNIDFYNLYMAELKKIASVNIGHKILSIAVGDASGNGCKEVLVGVADKPIRIIEGLYQVIPSFEVNTQATAGSSLEGKITVTNVTDSAISDISGKIYWFPKDNMQVEPQQIRLDLGPHESKSVCIQMMPTQEGTVIVRPIVLMWTGEQGQVQQVTTPETAILVAGGEARAAAASVASASVETASKRFTTYEEPSPFKPASGTGFGLVVEDESPSLEDPLTPTERSGVDMAQDLLDKLFGEQTGDEAGALDEIKSIVAEGQVSQSTSEEVAMEFDDVSAMSEVAVEPPIVEHESELVTEIRLRKPKPPKPGTASDAYTYLFKVMITGEGAVGKTTLVNRYVTGVFERDYKTTIGSQFAVKLTHISPPDSEYGLGIKLQAWDVAGQARFAAVRKMYYSGAAGVILVFDVTRRRSFTELPKWVEEADSSIGTRVPTLVVGNKIDLPDRTVSSDEALTWAEENGFLYMESSAKTGEGVADMFHVLGELMYDVARKTTEAKKKEKI